MSEKAYLPSPDKIADAVQKNFSQIARGNDEKYQSIHHAQMGYRDARRHNLGMGCEGRPSFKGEIIALFETSKISNEVEAEFDAFFANRNTLRSD